MYMWFGWYRVIVGGDLSSSCRIIFYIMCAMDGIDRNNLEMNVNINIISPLEQFNVIGYGLVTNGGIIMLLMILVVVILKGLVLGDSGKIVPSHWQSVIEMYFEFLESILKENTGVKGRKYLGFVITLFTYILLLNMFGMVPYVFATTAHFAVAITLSLSIWFGVTYIGISTHGVNFFSSFMPAGSPLALAPLLVIIEYVSYAARAISLGLRLAANIIAGHLLLAIIAGFGYTMMSSGLVIGIVGLFPVSIIYVLTFLEIAVCMIQAYVFTLLTCIYLNDAINLH